MGVKEYSGDCAAAALNREGKDSNLAGRRGREGDDGEGELARRHARVQGGV